MTLIVGRCLWCGTPLQQSLKGRDKVYCTRDCREKFVVEMKKEKDEDRDGND